MKTGAIRTHIFCCHQKYLFFFAYLIEQYRNLTLEFSRAETTKLQAVYPKVLDTQNRIGSLKVLVYSVLLDGRGKDSYSPELVSSRSVELSTWHYIYISSLRSFKSSLIVFGLWIVYFIPCDYFYGSFSKFGIPTACLTYIDAAIRLKSDFSSRQQQPPLILPRCLCIRVGLCLLY